MDIWHSLGFGHEQVHGVIWERSCWQHVECSLPGAPVHVWLGLLRQRDPLNLFHSNTFYPLRYTLAFDEPVTARYVLVWITGLPEGEEKVEIAEIELFRPRG